MDPATVSLFAASWKIAGAVGVLAVLLLIFGIAVVRWMAARIAEAESRALAREQGLVERVRQLEDRQHSEITALSRQLVSALEKSADALDRNARAFERWAADDTGRHPVRRHLPHLSPERT